MAMLADTIDGVIGVDTHRDTLTAAAVWFASDFVSDIRVLIRQHP